MAAQVGVFSLPKKQKQKQPNNNNKKTVAAHQCELFTPSRDF